MVAEAEPALVTSSRAGAPRRLRAIHACGGADFLGLSAPCPRWSGVAQLDGEAVLIECFEAAEAARAVLAGSPQAWGILELLLAPEPLLSSIEHERWQDLMREAEGHAWEPSFRAARSPCRGAGDAVVAEQRARSAAHLLRTGLMLVDPRALASLDPDGGDAFLGRVKRAALEPYAAVDPESSTAIRFWELAVDRAAATASRQTALPPGFTARLDRLIVYLRGS